VSASKQDKAPGNRRSRSGSLASNMHMNDDLMLVGDDHEREYHPTTAQR
jgi:hypothetical protein